MKMAINLEEIKVTESIIGNSSGNIETAHNKIIEEQEEKMEQVK